MAQPIIGYEGGNQAPEPRRRGHLSSVPEIGITDTEPKMVWVELDDKSVLVNPFGAPRNLEETEVLGMDAPVGGGHFIERQAGRTAMAQLLDYCLPHGRAVDAQLEAVEVQPWGENPLHFDGVPTPVPAYIRDQNASYYS